MEGRRVGKGSRGETCREGKWRGDMWGSGGETCSLGKWRGDCREVEGRRVPTSGGETVPKWRGDCREVEGRRVGKWRGDV